uniref:TTF-type domain-containing protein n=1 Tax=Kalanchoe fedtschenkoi TaxID=63787 RepID=A0A7N0T299_KALFE
MSLGINKFESCNEKLKKKKKIEKLIKSQQGALDKFVVKESQAPLEMVVDILWMIIVIVVIIIVKITMRTIIEDLNDDDNESLNFHIDIFDSRCWNVLDSKMIDVFAVKGPKRDKILDNDEFHNRDWLVYSKELDKVFCFCCKIFKKEYVKGGLVNECYDDWAHVAVRLQEHEVGLIEMLVESDPFIQEHVRRITNYDIHIHYLAKYFSIVLDCTPDVSHQEQMSMILRYVDLSSSFVVIEESFLGFINVNDTTGQGLFDVLLQELKSLGFDVDNVWQILKDNVKGLTLKSMLSTRWESSFDSVRAIRFQIVDIREALLQRLNGLRLLAIENDHLEKVAYEDLIENCVSKNQRRLILFI